VLSLSPQRIIIGGGVMKISGLIDRVRQNTLKYLGGYVQNETITSNIETFIQLPALGDRAGVLGAVALAKSLD
jgi:fructokinase